MMNIVPSPKSYKKQNNKLNAGNLRFKTIID